MVIIAGITMRTAGTAELMRMVPAVVGMRMYVMSIADILAAIIMKEGVDITVIIVDVIDTALSKRCFDLGHLFHSFP